jgi:hypothetical protein
VNHLKQSENYIQFLFQTPKNKKKRYIQLYFFSPNYTNHDKLKKQPYMAVHNNAEPVQLGRNNSCQTLDEIIKSSNSTHEINIRRVHLHDVNNWLPRVTMAVPSPINVVMDISVSRIRSNSVAISLIFGRRLDDGFRH